MAERLQADRLQLLNEISRTVSVTLDLRWLYDTIYEQIGRVMDTTHFFIALHRPEQNLLELPYAQVQGTLYFDQTAPFGDNTTSLIIQQGLPFLYHTKAEYDAYERSQGLHPSIVGEKDSASGIFVPLHTGSRTIGALSVQSDRPGAYTPDDVQTLAIIAAQAAIAIENARLFQEQQQRLAELQDLERALREREKLYRSLVEERERAERALRESEERFRVLFERSPDGILLIDPHDPDTHWPIVDCNQVAARMNGYTREELIGQSIDILLLDEPGQEDDEAYLEVVRQEGSVTDSCLHRRKDGSLFPMEYSTSIVNLGGRELVLGIDRDISERKRAEEALHAASQFNQAVIAHAQEGIVVYDRELRYVVWNPYMEQLTGMRAADVLGRHAPDVFPHLEEQGINHLLRRALQGETVRSGDIRYTVPGSGKSGWVCGSYAPHRDVQGGVVGVIGVITDVTARKQAEEMLQHYALHDALTDLPNRTLLRDRLQQAILAAERDRSPTALLFLDLDRFKDVNDTFGHHYGDLLLQQLGARLRAILRASDTIARLGGDEFAILLPVTDAVGATVIAQSIASVLHDPFEIDDHTFHIGASIGIAVYPEHGGDAVILMRRADIAMYAAKRTGASFVIYSPDHDVNSPARLSMLRDLRAAVENGELSLHYQPQVHLASGRVGQVEALLRWRHANQGLIPPDAFIPLAEESGLIKPLTQWVLDEALRQCSVWQAEGFAVRVAVNLSARSVHDPDLVHTVQRALQTWNVAPQCLALEITESAIILDPDRALETVTRLHDAGVHISIDDFGTGYSSLAHLSRLPIDEIKVDRSFVMAMTEKPDSAFIVRSIVDLAHNLGMQVVAEGVEDQATCDMLDLLRCEAVQGYYLSPPVPPADLTRWMRGQRDRPKSA